MTKVYFCNMKTFSKHILLIITLFCGFQSLAAENKADEKFNAFKLRFIDALWKMYPNWASSQGFHLYDNQLTITDENFLKNELRFCKTYSDSLNSIQVLSLSVNNRTDYYMVENQLNELKWANTTFKQYQWDPSMYNVGEGIANIITENYAPLDKRLLSLIERLEKVPAYYAAAMQNIKMPSIEHTDLAIDQNTGSLDILGQLLKDSVMKSGLAQNQKDLIL